MHEVLNVMAGEDVRDSVGNLKSAFELFDEQSRLLQSSYRALQQDLAEANRELSRKNRTLSIKVQELRQVSSRLACVLESMTDGVLVVNCAGIVELANASAEGLLNGGKGELEGRLFVSVVNMSGNEAVLSAVLEDAALVLERPWRCEKASGIRRQLKVSMAPVKAPDGSVLGAVCVLRDVTEIHRLEKKLLNQERLAALGEMAASVAHEIRNPLGTIEGFARLLRQDLAGMPQHLKLTDRIVEGAQNLNYVITNLLTYARPMNLNPAEISTYRLIELCRDTLHDSAKRAQVNLEINMPEKDICFCGDIRQMAQVLLNLGLNAIDACQDNGQVIVDFAKEAGSAILRVKDDGKGMDEITQQRIFDPFYTSKEGGTGLGLSLSRKIVDAHGGDISVFSESGRGSVFTVEVPLRGGLS